MNIDSTSPLTDMMELIEVLPGPAFEVLSEHEAREAHLTKPPGSLGHLEAISRWMSLWQGKIYPTMNNPRMAIFAADHGVVAENVSAFPQEVTGQMVENFKSGGAAICQLCQAYSLELRVFELAVGMPSGNISREDAMDGKTTAATMAYGMEAVEGDTDLLCIGEMGIGNTTVAAAIFHALWGGEAEDWVGPGTGVDWEGLKRKAGAVRLAVARIGRDQHPLEVLQRVGGREFAAMVGAIVAARNQRIPVILDGFNVSAAAAVLFAIKPELIDHCIASHVSSEPAHARVLALLKKKPVLDLGMRLGEGSGAALAAGIARGAVAYFNGMATFEEAKVSNTSGSSSISQ